MKLFDSDTAYGRGALALPREIENAAELIAELDHAGISEALVWHRDAWERDFAVGNQRLAEIDAWPRLHPELTFVPPHGPEMPSPSGFLEQMRRAGARAARAFPTHHCFCLDAASCGELLELFIAHAVPVFVPLPEIPGGWDGVYRLLRDFPKLTLVLTETGCWGQDRYFIPLMKQYPRFAITMNRLETAGQLKNIVDCAGADHLLFASGLPRNYPGAYALSLARAEIPNDARLAIAHGNIERILGEAAL